MKLEGRVLQHVLPRQARGHGWHRPPLHRGYTALSYLLPCLIHTSTLGGPYNYEHFLVNEKIEVSGARRFAQSHWISHSSAPSTESHCLKSLQGPRGLEESSVEQTGKQAPHHGRPPPFMATLTGAGQGSAVPYKAWVLDVILCWGSEATERPECYRVVVKVTRAATTRLRKRYSQTSLRDTSLQTTSTHESEWTIIIVLTIVRNEKIQSQCRNLKWQNHHSWVQNRKWLVI